MPDTDVDEYLTAEFLLKNENHEFSYDVDLYWTTLNFIFRRKYFIAIEVIGTVLSIILSGTMMYYSSTYIEYLFSVFIFFVLLILLQMWINGNLKAWPKMHHAGVLAIKMFCPDTLKLVLGNKLLFHHWNRRIRTELYNRLHLSQEPCFKNNLVKNENTIVRMEKILEILKDRQILFPNITSCTCNHDCTCDQWSINL